MWEEILIKKTKIIMFDDKQQQTSKWDNSPNVGRDYINNPQLVVNIQDNITKSPSMIWWLIQSIVPYIGSSELQEYPLTRSFEIIKKIDYNWLNKYKHTVMNLWKYEYIIECEFENLERKQPGLKTKFLTYIHNEYMKVKTNECTSDEIFDIMIDIVKHKYKESSDNNGNIFLEDIDYASECIIGRSFTKCKVLEVPPQ